MKHLFLSMLAGAALTLWYSSSHAHGMPAYGPAMAPAPVVVAPAFDYRHRHRRCHWHYDAYRGWQCHWRPPVAYAPPPYPARPAVTIWGSGSW